MLVQTDTIIHCSRTKPASVLTHMWPCRVGRTGLVEKITDLSQLSNKGMFTLLSKINTAFRNREMGENPAQGYKVFIEGGTTNVPLKFTLEEIGSRPNGSPLPIPTTPLCTFCNNLPNRTLTNSFPQVQYSLKRHPYVVPISHKTHWFNLKEQEQLNMIRVAQKIVEKHKGPSKVNSLSYELHTRIGTLGDQAVPHAGLYIKMA